MRSPAASTFFTTRPRATRGRGVRYARTIINAHHVSKARMQSPCARLVRIMPPTILPRHKARRPRRTLRSHDCQRASRKLNAHAASFCSPCAHHVPHCTVRPRRTLRSHECQRASRMLSVHAVACARLVRIISPTILAKRCARRPRRKIRTHHYQRASRKLSVCPGRVLAQPRPPGASPNLRLPQFFQKVYLGRLRWVVISKAEVFSKLLDTKLI
jgi:hypothetical protein